MNELFKYRMTKFLQEYVGTRKYHLDDQGIMHDATLESGIALLIKEGIMNKKEMQKEAARYGVILPGTLIDKCEEKYR